MLLSFPVFAVSREGKYEFICGNVVVLSAYCTKEALRI